MTKRQVVYRVRYLRKLYAEMEALSLSLTGEGKKRCDLAVKHLKCSVCLVLDAYEAQQQK